MVGGRIRVRYYRIMERLSLEERVRQSTDYARARRQLGQTGAKRMVRVEVSRREPEVPEIGEEIARIPAKDDMEWRRYANCLTADPEAFFPEKGQNAREAKKTCASCLVQSQCLDYALHNDEKYGIWGGMTEKERAAMRARRRRMGQSSVY